MSMRIAFWKWFAIGVVSATVLVVAQSAAVGGPGGLLQVGETSALRPMIEAELGEIPLAPGPGHDGQIFYAIGLDLTGEEVPGLLDHGAYRYRRIAYPLASSVFGLLDGWLLLYGMVVLAISSTGVAAGSVAVLCVRGGLSDWSALVILLNPGVWLSVRLLTSDVMAVAMMAGALAMLARRRWLGIAGFSLSGLAKDLYLVTPAGLSVSPNRKRWLLLAVPLVVLVVWMTLLTLSMGEGFTGRGNLSWPGVGLVNASANWNALDTEEWVYLLFAMASVAAGLVVGVIRRSWLRWSILGWSGLGLISSNWVWDFGNNAARAFAPIVVLIALSYVPTETALGADSSDVASAGVS